MVTIKYNKEKKLWEPTEDKEDKYTITFDGRLIPLLDRVRKDLHNDHDFAMLICGGVGSGKSNLARLCARYVSNEHFHPRTHIVQDVSDIKRVLDIAKKGDGVIFDEASGIFASTDTMTKKTKYANQVLDVCRQKNLFLLIIAPSFHRLGNSVALDRTKVLLRTYVDKKGRRGPFAFYGTRLKEKLYLESKRNHGSQKGINPKWRGTFGLDKTFTEEYRKVKDETLNKVLDSWESPKSKILTQSQILRNYHKSIVIKNPDLSCKELGKILDVTPRAVQNYKKEIKDSLEKEALLRPYIEKRDKNIEEGLDLNTN